MFTREQEKKRDQAYEHKSTQSTILTEQENSAEWQKKHEIVEKNLKKRKRFVKKF